MSDSDDEPLSKKKATPKKGASKDSDSDDSDDEPINKKKKSAPAKKKSASVRLSGFHSFSVLYTCLFDTFSCVLSSLYLYFLC